MYNTKVSISNVIVSEKGGVWRGTFTVASIYTIRDVRFTLDDEKRVHVDWKEESIDFTIKSEELKRAIEEEFRKNLPA